VIVNMKYPGYFLIVWDFIREAKARGIPVGPVAAPAQARSSLTRSSITEIDPLPYALLFERFSEPGARQHARLRRRLSAWRGATR
jgi:DNA polymerase-3 subunit alpha